MYLFDRNGTEQRATRIAALKHVTPAVKIVADSTTGCTVDEDFNGIVSSPRPYIYKSHRIQGTQLLMTCLPAMHI